MKPAAFREERFTPGSGYLRQTPPHGRRWKEGRTGIAKEKPVRLG